MLATATPTVTLSDNTSMTDEELLIAYRDAADAAKRPGATSQDRALANRHFRTITERVEDKVRAAANAVLRDQNKYDSADRDIAVWTAIGRVATDDKGYASVLKGVRKGHSLANCVASFVTMHDMDAELNQGTAVSATSDGGGRMPIVPTDFTADETHRTIAGATYTLDALDEALDVALHGARSDMAEAQEWVQQVISGHGVTLTTRESDALFHSLGFTDEMQEYLDRLAESNPKEAARILGSIDPNERRISAPRLPQDHVANLTGTHRSTVSRDLDNAENAIWAKPDLVRELRRGSNGNRRVIFEDIANHCANWLLDNYAQADMFPTEAAIRVIPEAAWRSTMHEFGYDMDDYTDEDINDIVETVIAFVTRNTHRRIIRHLIQWMKSRVSKGKKPTEQQVLATTHLWQERILDEFAYDLDECSEEQLKRIIKAVITGAKK